jgi:hypothetical protein
MHISRLIPSIDLIRRMDAAATAYTLARLKILERIPGNPIGVAHQTIDNVTALAARHLPSASFNCVRGLRAGQAHLVQTLAEWQRAHGAGGGFEIAAGDDDPELGRELARAGFYQAGFHAALIGEPDHNAPATPDVRVDAVASARDMEDFLSAYVAGWGVPEEKRESFKSNVRAWVGETDWSLYVARVDARPAAAAVLYRHGGAGYFADCATDPAFRTRGLHAALLRRRWRDASGAGVDFVCSGASFLSTSHRNMERIGMRLLLLRAIWAPLESSNDAK